MAKITNPYYEELAYIVSTGTQYIDTGIQLKPSLKIKLEFKLIENNENKVPFGISNPATYVIYTYQGYLCTYNNGTVTNLASYNTNRNNLTVDYSNKTYDYNGTTGILNGTSGTSNNSLFIFARNTNGSATNISKLTLWNVEIYDDDVLIRNFVPARREDTGVIGLLDIVNNVFYTNKGTGTFSYGLLADVTVDPVNSGTITGNGEYTVGSNVTLTAIPNSGYTFEKWLDKDYVLLSAIESTGTQYINPNLNTSRKRRIEIGLAASSTSRYNIYGIGGGGSASDITYSIRFGSSSYPKFAFLSRSNSPGTVITDVDVDTNKHDIVLDIANSIGTIDGAHYSLYENTGTTSYAEYIFAYSRLGTVDNNYSFIGKIYYARYYEDDVLIRNFVPVLKYGVGFGLLDLVEMKFYGNSGTGDFRGYQESGPTQYASVTDNPWTVSNISNSLILTAQFKKTANCRYKVNGTWKNAMMYIKQNGTWKPGTPKIKVNGNWKEGG